MESVSGGHRPLTILIQVVSIEVKPVGSLRSKNYPMKFNLNLVKLTRAGLITIPIPTPGELLNGIPNRTRTRTLPWAVIARPL